MANLKNIPTREDFTDSQGRFVNYDTYDDGQRSALGNQKHVNLRSFVSEDFTKRITMADVNLLNMTLLDTRTVGDLDGQTLLRKGESWTNGTVGKQADRLNWRGITVTCTAGITTITESVTRI